MYYVVPHRVEWCRCWTRALKKKSVATTSSYRQFKSPRQQGYKHVLQTLRRFLKMLDGSALPLLFCGAVAAGIALVQWELMKAKQKAAMPKRIVLIRHGNIHWYTGIIINGWCCSSATMPMPRRGCVLRIQPPPPPYIYADVHLLGYGWWWHHTMCRSIHGEFYHKR